MLKGFDKETAPLTEYEEKVLLPVVIRGLSTKFGKYDAVTNNHIIKCLREKVYRIDAVRLRKIINYIRTKDLIPGLIATSDGYYIATTEQELIEYEESLRGREDAIRAVRLSIARQRRRIYEDKNQKKLF